MEIIDLGIGHPDDSILPLADLKQASLHRLSLTDTSCLQYGPEEGSISFRAQLAGFLTRNYGAAVRSENLIITAGASHGLDLILSQLSRPGDTIFVEDPTYFFALDVLKGRNMRIVPIPTDKHGLDIDALERRLKDDQPTFLYTIPIFHNPTGTILPTSRRDQLLRLAKEHNFLIIADEVYQLLGDKNEIPLPLAVSDDERVLSLGSFSKILGPGIRLGWIQCAPKHIATLIKCGVLRSGGGVNPFAAAIVESAIELGIQDKCLMDLRTIYNKRRTFTSNLLENMLPAEVKFISPQGGFFIWLELPHNIDTSELSEEALKMNINFKPGVFFSCEGRFSNCIRICFTFYSEDKLQFACEQLSNLLHRYI